MADEFKLDLEKILVEQNGGWAGGTADWIYAFGKSAVEAVPELIGITPSQDSLRFRAQYPVSGVVSELAGMAVPYGSWMRAARGIPALERLATGVEATQAGKAAFQARALEAPFMTGARAEAVRLAPFEFGRTLASVPFGDQPLGEVAVGAGLNLALGAGVGGVFGKIGASAKRVPGLREVAPGVDEMAPMQLRLRKMDELEAQDPLVKTPQWDEFKINFERQALAETAPKSVRYVDPAIDKKGELEGLFVPGGKFGGLVESKRLTTGSTVDTFPSALDWESLLAEQGLDPRAAARNMQYPRVLSVNPSKEVAFAEAAGLEPTFEGALKAATKVEDRITRGLQQVGDGWFLKQEPNGMFVMARKIRGEVSDLIPREVIKAQVGPKTFREFQTQEALVDWLARNPKKKLLDAKTVAVRPTREFTPSIDDKWLVFKTDRPGDFVKNSQNYMNASVAQAKWVVGDIPLEAAAARKDLVGDMLGMQKLFPREKFEDAATAAGGKPGRMGQLLEKILPKTGAAGQAAKDFMREYLVPAQAQFRHSIRGNWLMSQSRMINDGVDTWYQKLLQGELKFSGKGALFSKIVNSPGAARPLEQLAEELYSIPGGIDDFMRLMRDGIPPEGAARLAAEGQISPRVAALAREFQDTRRLEHGQLNISEEINGKKASKLREDDYGFRRNWDGDHLKLVREEGGRIAGVAAGHSGKAAAKRAEDLAADMARKSGGKFRPAEAFMRGAPREGIPKDVWPFLDNPGAMLNNRQVRGFKWDLETPTKEEFLDEIFNSYRGRAQVVSTNIREAALTRDLAALEIEDPHVARMIVQRWNQMAGHEGEFSKAQNRFADRVLAPVLGANSATKLVRYTNTAMHHLQLGAGKLSYPIQNIIGTIQTVMPEIAFRLNAGVDDLARAGYMVTGPAVGAQGVVGSLSTLAPVKVMGQAIKMMIKPSAEERQFFEWMLNNRVLDARVGEDFIGQNRRTLSNWKGAVTSAKGLGEYMLALSEWMPVHSERFARTLAAAAAYKVFKDVGRIADEDLLRLQAKRFVERTNYLYSAADRPLVFTSPVGSAMGLFKTWQMNYIATMVQYANLGMEKGVWSPLMWQTMGTAAVGGAAATPLYWLANGASEFLQQKSLVQYAYDEWQGQADGIMFGLPAALTGVSLSSLSTVPGANPVKDATQLFSFAIWQRARDAGGSVLAAFDNWKATGQHPASDPDVRNGLIKAFAPVLLTRAMSLEDDTVRNISTGLPSAKGLSWYDRMAYMAGLQPTMLERQAFVSNELYQHKEKMKNATRAFSDAYAEAIQSGDNRNVDIVLQRALALGVDVSSVLQGGNTRLRQSRETAAERLSNPQTLSRYQNILP